MTRRSSESMIFMISPNKPKLPTDYCRDLFFSPCHRIVHPPPVLIAGFVTKHFFKLYQIYSAACLYVCTLRSSYYDVLRATFFFLVVVLCMMNLTMASMPVLRLPCLWSFTL